MPSTHRYGTRTALPKTSYSVTNAILRGLSPEDIYDIKNARDKISSVLKGKKSPHFNFVRIEIEKKLDAILRSKSPKIAGFPGERLSESETQSLRDEVLKMVKNKKPRAGIPVYRGKSSDGNPIEFFREHYKNYIRRGNEVIFSVDLISIDKKLLTAMRNNASADELPIGSTVARTDAILNGRFKDDDESWSAAAFAKAARRRRHVVPPAYEKSI